MVAVNHIADLDAALSRRGSDVVLRRMTTPVTDLTVRAAVRPYPPEEVAGGIMNGDLKAVLSPTGLDDAEWVAAFATTGGISQAAPFDVPAWLPKRGDRIIIENRLRTIESVMPINVDGQIVRITLQVR